MAKAVMFGLAGPRLSEEEKEFFSKNKIFGFILFKRNIESRAQLKELIDELKSLYIDNKIIIAVDQEGGRVARLLPAVIENKYPAAEYFSKLYETHGKDTATQAVEENYTSLMKDLEYFGIHTPLSPVADLRYSFTDNVIGDRSFGFEVDKVVALCSGAAKAIKDNGGFPVIKHIPGHGLARVDSHFELPHITTSLEELKKSDFAVFELLSKDENIVSAMTAHIVYDALDPELPVTLSKKAINFIRQDIGFKGLLFSDDICMLALHGEIGAKYSQDKTNSTSHEQFIKSLANVARAAYGAGCDIILHCSGNMAEITAVYEALPFAGEEFAKLYDNLI